MSRLRTNTVNNNDIGIYLQDVEEPADRRPTRCTGQRRFGSRRRTAGSASSRAEPGLGGDNVFKKNEARTNEGLDCEDGTSGAGTGGTGNVWTGNRGVDDNPAAICAP